MNKLFNEETRTRIKDGILFLCIIVPFYSVMQLMGITCPIKWLTGISCAGCGMTRAWMSVLHLNFIEAFYYHPLWFILIPCLLVFIFKEYIPEKIYKSFVIIVIILFLIVYIYRMFTTQEIVVFHPEQGFIYHVIKTVIKYLI